MVKNRTWLQRSYSYKILAVMLWIIFCFPGIVAAAQEIPATIEQNLVLTSEQSPYQTNNNLIINPNNTLTLAPKTNLEIPGSLILKGKLELNPEAVIHIKGNLYKGNDTAYLDEYIKNHQIIVDGQIKTIDTTPPNIISKEPIDTIGITLPQIKVKFSDVESPVDLNSLQVFLDDINITQEITTKDLTGFSYLPKTPLSYGQHKITVTLGNISGLSQTEEWSFKIINDISAPQILDFSPKETTTNPKTPIIINYQDLESDIDLRNLKITLDGQNITGKVKIKDQKHLVYNPAAPLRLGLHKVEVAITNNVGLTTIKVWTFTITDPAAPIIKVQSVKSNQIVYNRHLPITFSLSDAHSGINLKSLTVYLDTQRIKTISKTGPGTYKFIPVNPLSTGAHTITISVKDNSGLTKTLKLTFKIATPGFTPVSNELWVEVNQKNQRVYIMKGTKVMKEIICSTGRPETPTPNGIFRIQNRGSWFLADGGLVGAKHWVSFKGYGKYMFHSILFEKTGKHIVQSSVRKLGSKASHGCIRLPLKDAIWFYKNIPGNTRVVIFEK